MGGKDILQIQGMGETLRWLRRTKSCRHDIEEVRLTASPVNANPLRGKRNKTNSIIKLIIILRVQSVTMTK
jgi:hypothetical protein